MRILRTALVASSLALGLGVAASAPAEAHIHFGGGGFGGGGFGGGGFGGGGFGGGHFGHFGHWGHWGHWGGFGIGVVDVGGDDCVRWRPMFDSDGNFIGRRPVNVCY